MLPIIQTEFIITGTNILPEQITQELGISPTRTWMSGDSIQATQLSRKHNGWCFSTGKSERILDCEKSLVMLIKHLLPYAKAISTLCEMYELQSEISCAIYISDVVPIINLRPETISQLAQLHTFLDIDIIQTK